MIDVGPAHVAAVLLLALSAGTAAASATSPLPTTTAPSIALRNLDYMVDRSGRMLTLTPGDPVALARWLDALLTRVQFLGTFDDLSDAERRSARAIATLGDDAVPGGARSAGLHIERARVLAQLHRFDEARDLLDRAAATLEAMGSDAPGRLGKALVAERRAIDLATGAAQAVLADLRPSEASMDFEGATQRGTALAALGRREEAEQAYRAALADWDGLTPFAPAWVEFRIGEVWNGVDDRRARHHFERALAILPAYVTARVHLAELVAVQDGPEAALEVLEPALESADPEPAARMAEFAAAAGRREADALRQRAAERWEALLAQHPLAFADHAAEFYLGAGDDADAAYDWARRNLANRATDRARGLVILAALAAGEPACLPGVREETSDPMLMEALAARRAVGVSCPE